MTDLKKVPIHEAADAVITCFRTGNKLLLCGNGGSSADCAHIVGELAKGFTKKRPLPDHLQKELKTDKLQMGLPAIDLTANTALVSAINNDLGGDYVYAQQVMAYGKPGDVIIGISTSGNSRNVALAIQCAKAIGLKTIGMTGFHGGILKQLCDIVLQSDEQQTYLIQEDHLIFYHRFCIMIEEAFYTV